VACVRDHERTLDVLGAPEFSPSIDSDSPLALPSGIDPPALPTGGFKDMAQAGDWLELWAVAPKREQSEELGKLQAEHDHWRALARAGTQKNRALQAQLEAATGNCAAWETLATDRGNELSGLHTKLSAARAQFRAITGDFPGLTGPLVDLFK
jgi:hypothetical protein